jgi:hypothetical protein
MGSESPDGTVARAAFAVPPGAATPDHHFAGSLELSGEGLPGFSFDFLQVGNHLFPVSRGEAGEGEAGMDYIVGTGRIWRELGDYGFSRAYIPFQLVQGDGSCVQDGVLTLLFSDDGATSKAIYRISGDHCDSLVTSRVGTLQAIYFPGPADAQALDLESVLSCAADVWLPLVKGRGGISLQLMPDGKSRYVLADAGTQFWFDAANESGSISGLCK